MPEPMTLAEARNNLDLFSASHAQTLVPKVQKQYEGEKTAEKTENLITRTLGVLQGQGVYAAFLWLMSRSGKDDAAAKAISKCLAEMLNAIDPHYALESDPKKLLEKLATHPIMQDLPALLLAKRVMERMLTYARYHAKAEGGNG